MRHQLWEQQCSSFVFHVQDTLPKKLNANQILNSIHSYVDLQYKSVLCMCVLERVYTWRLAERRLILLWAGC